MADVPSRSRPSRLIPSADGTPIAVFSSGTGPPLLLVHGAAADHTTFRVVGPMFARRFSVHAVDRRGRGASGDTPPYAVDREYEDLRGVADVLGREAGRPVDVVGHSFGGRVALGAALEPGRFGRLVVYEGAPPAAAEPYQAPDLSDRLRTLLRGRGPEAMLIAFLADVVGLTPGEIADYRRNPVWPDRVAAAPTVVRELEAEASVAAGLDRLGDVRAPVLQIVGGESRGAFGAAAEALGARLANGRLVVIHGARHAAHHSHPDRFVAVVEGFLEG